MGNELSNDKEPTQNGKVCEKHEKNGSVNITSNGLEINVNGEAKVHPNEETLPPSPPTEAPDGPVVEAEVKSDENEPVAKKEEVKKSKPEKVSLFKMFKKKSQPPAVEDTQQKEASQEDQTDVGAPSTEPQMETDNPQQEPETIKEPESVTGGPGPEEENETESQPEENQEEGDPENNPVMNFFKTLVTPTKPSKKVTAAPGSSKEQSQETQPAGVTTTAQVSEAPAAPKAMSIPPPPPPEPPKMEIKGEPAAKLVKPSPKEEKKAAAKKPEASKGKSAKDTLGKFFRSKEKPVEVQQPVIDIKVEPQETAEEAAEAVVEEQTVDGEPQPPEKVDPSKAGTLEAAAKPEPPPPVQEEKKTATKSSFFSVFKQKAAEPKKVGAAPPAAPEAAQTAKTKEEPKAVAKSSDAVVDNKQASAASEAAEDLAKIPKKLEKRNSIQLFFKALGQKRHSTDAGVQTEQTTVAQAAEKTK